jgi:phosphate uptake regulator
VQHLNKQLNMEFLNAIKEMNEMAISSFETAIESLFRRDYNLADSVIAIANKIVELEKKVILSSNATNIEEATNIRLVIESVRRIAEYSMDIAEVVLNMTVESIII